MFEFGRLAEGLLNDRIAFLQHVCSRLDLSCETESDRKKAYSRLWSEATIEETAPGLLKKPQKYADDVDLLEVAPIDTLRKVASGLVTHSVKLTVFDAAASAPAVSLTGESLSSEHGNAVAGAHLVPMKNRIDFSGSAAYQRFAAQLTHAIAHKGRYALPQASLPARIMGYLELVNGVAEEWIDAQSRLTDDDRVDPRLPQILLPDDDHDYIAVTPVAAASVVAEFSMRVQPSDESSRVSRSRYQPAVGNLQNQTRFSSLTRSILTAIPPSASGMDRETWQFVHYHDAWARRILSYRSNEAAISRLRSLLENVEAQTSTSRREQGFIERAVKSQFRLLRNQAFRLEKSAPARFLDLMDPGAVSLRPRIWTNALQEVMGITVSPRTVGEWKVLAARVAEED